MTACPTANGASNGSWTAARLNFSGAMRGLENMLSAIVVAERYAGVKGDEETAELDRFVALFPMIPITAEIAKAGGLIKRDCGKSHGVGLADAILAATAEAENAELKTLNPQH